MVAKKTKKSNQPKKTKPEAQKTEYTRAGLIRMSREAVNEVALGFNLNPKRFANKELMADAIMREVWNGDDGIDQQTGLNPKQELFCQLYANDRSLFGNGTQAYIEAYDVDLSVKGAYGSARADSSRLLTNANILKRVRELLEGGTLNDEAVDKQLDFWIQQQANPMASIAAIKEYNKVKKRTVDMLAAGGALALTQNNYTVHITDDRGKFLADKYQSFMEHVTKREPTEEEDKARRAVPAEVVAKMTRAQ